MSAPAVTIIPHFFNVNVSMIGGVFAGKSEIR
jgi:hypothetical protein